ncbi:hypothetical protein D3C81_1254110 [compost metagenome]
MHRCAPAVIAAYTHLSSGYRHYSVVNLRKLERMSGVFQLECSVRRQITFHRCSCRSRDLQADTCFIGNLHTAYTGTVPRFLRHEIPGRQLLHLPAEHAKSGAVRPVDVIFFWSHRIPFRLIVIS